MNGTSLADLRAVLAVARHGGFRAAARDLGVASSGLSQAVAGLESRLAVRLFNRTTRSVSLTEAGQRFVAEILPAVGAIDTAIDNAGDTSTQLSGLLRLNMAPGAARFLLRGAVLIYLHRHQQMQVELLTEGNLIDVIGEGFDAGIRMRSLVPPDMIAVPIYREMRSVVVAAPEYLSRRGVPQTPHDLRDHTCIRVRLPSGRYYHWEFSRQGQELRLDVPGQLTLDESELMRQAALAGAGLAYLSETAVVADLESGALVEVLADWLPAEEGLCLYYSGRRHVPAKLTAFIAVLREFSQQQTGRR